MIELVKHTQTFFILSFTICIMTQCTNKSSLPLSYGAFVKGNKTNFKVKAPRADRVFLVLFEKPEDDAGTELLMKKSTDGDWTITTKLLPIPIPWLLSPRILTSMLQNRSL